jgi:hypothetical protein
VCVCALSVLCLSVRLQGAHLAQAFKYSRSRMMGLTHPLLIEIRSAICQVVMR